MHTIDFNKVLEISREIGDGLGAKLADKILPTPIHVACRKKYIKCSAIAKRERETESEEIETIPKRKSQIMSANIQYDCLYCGEPVHEYNGPHQRVPVHRRTSIHQAETKELLDSVTKKSEERNDDWGECVKIKIQCIGDLIAAEAVYQHECQVRFHACKVAPGWGCGKGRLKGHF